MPDGTVIRIDGTAPAGGAKLQGMLRPEAIQLAAANTEAGAGASGNPVNTLSGRIVERHYLGPMTEYIVEAGGVRLKVHAAGDIETEAVQLTFSDRDCQLVMTDA